MLISQPAMDQVTIHRWHYTKAFVQTRLHATVMPVVKMVAKVTIQQWISASPKAKSITSESVAGMALRAMEPLQSSK